MAHFEYLPENAAGRLARHFWETSSPPALLTPSGELKGKTAKILGDNFPEIMAAPFLNPADIRNRQLLRISEIANIAWKQTPVYESRLKKFNLDHPRTLSWDEFKSIQPISKLELIRAFPSQCINHTFEQESLYPTRSSGSTGATLDIRIDEDAIALDTVQGVRQAILQSGLQYNTDDEITHVYTVPWVIDQIESEFVNHFVSSLIAPKEISTILSKLNSSIISLYPSVLREIAKHSESWDRSNLRTIITHSEQSSKLERTQLSRDLGVNILDEYSSEEATRIALEMPCGHYHTCDDTVLVEILDPDTFETQEPGKLGIVVITNLLNTAMPFIRYVQGDLAIAGESKDCKFGWGILESIKGRQNDSFLRKDGAIIPAGTLLDMSYRMMFDIGLSIEEFELVQQDYDTVLLRYSKSPEEKIATLKAALQNMLNDVFSHEVNLDSEEIKEFRDLTSHKVRPIRRTFQLPFDQ